MSEAYVKGRPQISVGWSKTGWLGGLLLFLQLTALYGYAGYIGRIPDAKTLSLLTIALNLFYVLINIGSVIVIFRRWYVSLFLIFIWIMPLFVIFVQFAVGIYPIDRFLYWEGYVSFFGSLFLVALVFGYRVDQKYVTRLLLLALVVISFEFAYNFQSFLNVRPVLHFIGSPISISLAYDRILGFFPHPNEAALAVNMCLFGLLFWREARFGFSQLAIIAFAMGLILLTGSRTSLILSFLVIGGYFYRAIFAERAGGAKVLLTMAFAVPVLAVVVAVVATQSSGSSSMAQRVTQLLGFFTEQGGGSDQSASLRVTAITQFIDIILDNPFLGVGYDRLSDAMIHGETDAVSQISWLQWGAEYGIFYPFCGLFAFLAIYWRSRQALRGSRLVRKAGFSLSFLMFIIFMYSLSLIDIFLVRSVVAVMGIALGGLVRALRLARLASRMPDAIEGNVE